MLFNPDPSKEVIEIHFPHKRDNEHYDSLGFNGTKVQLGTIQKQVRSILVTLIIDVDIDSEINKCNKVIAIIKRLF